MSRPAGQNGIMLERIAKALERIAGPAPETYPVTIIGEPEIYLSWSDDGVTLICERAECMEYEDGPENPPTSWWQLELPGRPTPELAVQIRDQHLATHRDKPVYWCCTHCPAPVCPHAGKHDQECQICRVTKSEGKFVMPNCAQCGKPFGQPACGPSHALIAADETRHNDHPRNTRNRKR